MVGKANAPRTTFRILGLVIAATSAMILGSISAPTISFSQQNSGSFALTRNAGIPGFNDETHDNVSVQACQRLCIERSWCKSVDYERASARCFIQPVSKLEQALKQDYPGNPYDHYHRLPGSADNNTPYRQPTTSQLPDGTPIKRETRKPTTLKLWHDGVYVVQWTVEVQQSGYLPSVELQETGVIKGTRRSIEVPAFATVKVKATKGPFKKIVLNQEVKPYGCITLTGGPLSPDWKWVKSC